MIRVLVTGDRHFRCVDLARAVLGKMAERYDHEVTIVHGDCGGVDGAFNQVAGELGLAVEAYPANWAKHDAAAGPIRNQQMVDLGANFCIAVHKYLKGSKGTVDCIRRCLDAGIPVYIFESDEPVYVRLDRELFKAKIARGR